MRLFYYCIFINLKVHLQKYIGTRPVNPILMVRAFALGAGDRACDPWPRHTKPLKWYRWLPFLALSIMRQRLVHACLVGDLCSSLIMRDIRGWVERKTLARHIPVRTNTYQLSAVALW